MIIVLKQTIPQGEEHRHSMLAQDAQKHNKEKQPDNLRLVGFFIVWHRLVLLGSIPSLLERNLLILRNSQSVDAKEVADASDDQMCPMEVDNHGKEEIGHQIIKLQCGADRGKPEEWQVSNNRAANQWGQHDRPEWEGLVRQMGQNHLSRHATKNKGHGQAEEDEVVLLHQSAVWRENPGTSADSEDGHGRQLEEHREDWQVVLLAGANNVVDAKGDVCHSEEENEEANPDISERDFANKMGDALQMVSPDVRNRFRPDLRATDARYNHDAAGQQQALRWAIDVTKVERVCVICLPRGEPHWQTRAQRRENTRRCSS